MQFSVESDIKLCYFYRLLGDLIVWKEHFPSCRPFLPQQTPSAYTAEKPELKRIPLKTACQYMLCYRGQYIRCQGRVENSENNGGRDRHIARTELPDSYVCTHAENKWVLSSRLAYL